MLSNQCTHSLNEWIYDPVNCRNNDIIGSGDVRPRREKLATTFRPERGQERRQCLCAVRHWERKGLHVSWASVRQQRRSRFPGFILLLNIHSDYENYDTGAVINCDLQTSNLTGLECNGCRHQKMVHIFDCFTMCKNRSEITYNKPCLLSEYPYTCLRNFYAPAMEWQRVNRYFGVCFVYHSVLIKICHHNSFCNPLHNRKPSLA